MLLITFLIFLLTSPLAAYEKPSKLKNEVWEQALPFLFPENHPSNDFLKSLFKTRRVTHSKDSLKKSGFSNLQQQPFTKMTTALHKSLPGLFFKIYLDPQKPYKRKPDYYHWFCRIKGAEMIRQIVKKNGWEDSFKIPKKWMYPLPSKPAPNPLFTGVFFVLIEEDMGLAPFERNLEMWKSDLITPKVLDRLFTILTRLGLSDCTSPKNLPFTLDGKIAFIDTQTTMTFPVNTNRLCTYLTSEMGAYWRKLSKEKKGKS